MVTRIKKAINNSKNKKGFKQRANNRIEKKQRQAKVEENEYVDAKELLAKKREAKKAKKAGKAEPKPEGSDDEMEESEGDKELEQQVEKDAAEEAEVNNADALDESIFNKFATGELDLPENDDDEELVSEEEQVDDDSELEAYYEELGIDPTEMQDGKTKEVD